MSDGLRANDFPGQLTLTWGLAERTQVALVHTAQTVAKKAEDGVLTAAAVELLSVRQEKAEAATEIIAELNTFVLDEPEVLQLRLVKFLDYGMRYSMIREKKIHKAEFYADILVIFNGGRSVHEG